MPSKLLSTGAAGGFLVALVSAVLATLYSSLEYQLAEILGLANLLLGALLVNAWALLQLPASERATLQQRLQSVILASLAMCSVYTLVIWLHYAVIDPGYLAEFQASYAEKLRASATDAAAAARAEAVIEQNRGFLLDPFKQAMLMGGTLLGISAFCGLLLAVLLRPRARN